MARSRTLRQRLPSSRSASPSSSSASDRDDDAASSSSPPPKPARRAARQVQYRSLEKGRRYDSDDSASEADSPARRAPPTRRGATRSAVLYLAIGVGLLGVCVLGWWLYRSSQDASSSAAASTPMTTSTATVSAAAASATALEPPTSLVDGSTSSSPASPPRPTADDSSSADGTMHADAKASKPEASHTAASSGPSGAKSSGTGSAAASSETWSGKATFYQQRGVAGNCGKVNPEGAMICALQTKLYADGKNCGRMIRLTRSDNGESVEVEVADQCPSCVEEGYVDLSEGAYDKLGTRAARPSQVEPDASLHSIPASQLAPLLFRR